MMILGILAFYGLAVLLSVGGLAFFFRIGRVGPAQFRSYRMPAPQRLTSDDYDAIADVVGIPTSPSDLLLSFTPIGWVSTFVAWLFLLVRRPSLAFIGIIIGGLFGKLWYMMSIPLLALEIVLLQTGVSYRPQWIVPGLKWETAISYIIGGYFVAYFIGKAVGSRQRSFNTARLAYERVVARRGYWFDN